MATIKGQNLRLFYNGRVIAAAKSLTLHVAANIVKVDSKDSGEWDENICTGKSWDGSVDALVVFTDHVKETTPISLGSPVTIEGVSVYKSEAFTLHKGETVAFSASLAASGATKILRKVGETYTVLATGSSSNVQYTNATENMDVCVGHTMNVMAGTTYAITGNGITTDDLIDLVEAGAAFHVEFATSEGAQNRTKDEIIREGDVLLNDVSIQASNKDLGVVSCKFVGTGELEEPEE